MADTVRVLRYLRWHEVAGPIVVGVLLALVAPWWAAPVACAMVGQLLWEIALLRDSEDGLFRILKVLERDQ